MGAVSKQESGTGASRRLGPAVYTETKVNGVPTKTLVDIGSPATIIMLDYVMDLLAAARKPHQTPAQWEKETLQKFSPTVVALTAYRGEALDIFSQIPLHPSLDDWTVRAVILVQNGAPNDFLGTDVQSQLKFTL